jgi:hypothetical protein
MRDATTFRRHSSTVSIKFSTMQSDCGCRGVVRVLLTPRRCKTSSVRRDSKLRPWSLRSPAVLRSGTRSGNQRFRHCRSLLVGNDVGFGLLGKVVHSDQEVSVSFVALWEGPCYIDGYPFERKPRRCIYARPY